MSTQMGTDTAVSIATDLTNAEFSAWGLSAPAAWRCRKGDAAA